MGWRAFLGTIASNRERVRASDPHGGCLKNVSLLLRLMMVSALSKWNALSLNSPTASGVLGGSLRQLQ